jgi:hypothetical protein
MLREDLKAHEIRKRIVAKDCVNAVIIPMALLREEACVFLKRPFSKVICSVTGSHREVRESFRSIELTDGFLPVLRWEEDMLKSQTTFFVPS